MITIVVNLGQLGQSSSLKYSDLHDDIKCVFDHAMFCLEDKLIVYGDASHPIMDCIKSYSMCKLMNYLMLVLFFTKKYLTAPITLLGRSGWGTVAVDAQ